MSSISKKRVVFMGTPRYAERILLELLGDDRFEVTLVLTQPDRPVGRKKVMTSPPVKTTTAGSGIEVLQPIRLGDPGIVEQIAARRPDFIVVAAYGHILPEQILEIAPCINLHASLLPKYRGASPIQQAILNGDRFTGITAMLMEKGLDSGDILAHSCIEIGDDAYLGALTEKLTDMASKLTLEVLFRFDSLMPLRQHDSSASVCRKIKRSDGEVDLSNAVEVYRAYRAFEGWPGVFLPNGLKLKHIEFLSGEGSYSAGEIVAFEQESMTVGCLEGSLKIDLVQPRSKKEMSARAYAAGRGLKIGDTIL